MTVCNNSLVNKIAASSRKRLTMVNAAFLLVAIGVASNAHADVEAASGPAYRVAATSSPEHHPRPRVHARPAIQEAVKAKAVASSGAQAARAGAALPSDGDELTPIEAATPAQKPAGPSLGRLADWASSLVHRLGRVGAGPSPWRGHGAAAGNLWPRNDAPPMARGQVTADRVTPGATDSFGDLLRGSSGGGLPAVPAAAAWAILLVGFLGLRVLVRSPRVARAQAWAATTLATAPRSEARAKARGWAVDRVDPERYVQARVQRSRQGRFVRAAAARFGPDAR